MESESKVIAFIIGHISDRLDLSKLTRLIRSIDSQTIPVSYMMIVLTFKNVTSDVVIEYNDKNDPTLISFSHKDTSDALIIHYIKDIKRKIKTSLVFVTKKQEKEGASIYIRDFIPLLELYKDDFVIFSTHTCEWHPRRVEKFLGSIRTEGIHMVRYIPNMSHYSDDEWLDLVRSSNNRGSYLNYLIRVSLLLSFLKKVPDDIFQDEFLMDYLIHLLHSSGYILLYLYEYRGYLLSLDHSTNKTNISKSLTKEEYDERVRQHRINSSFERADNQFNKEVMPLINPFDRSVKFEDTRFDIARRENQPRYPHIELFAK